MAGQITTKTFHGGMNKDVDISLLKENEYIHAENYKLVADDASNGYILENAEGNESWLDLSGISGLDDTYFLVGHCFIKPYLVLFYTTVVNDTAPSGGDSTIVRLTIDGGKIQEEEIIYEDGVGSTYLDLSTTYPISAVGYYEAPDNIKVYWTDNYNSVRVINIMDTSLDDYTAGMLDITPDFPLSTSVEFRPELATSLVAGSLKACSVQYAYQYFLKEGVQTLWSPASKIQIIPENNTILAFGSYKGGEVDEVTAYGVKVSINIPSENLYTHMRVVAIQYNSYNAVPLIRILNEYPLDTATSYTLTIVDAGESISELTYEEFSIQNTTQYRAKDLAIKDNRLFLANINETLYDVEIDCRAYRHNSGGTARLYESDLSTNIDVPGSVIGWATVGLDHDCINKYNNPTTETSALYKYQADGVTLGAEGIYVTVGFTYNGYRLDTLGVDSTGSTTNNITVAQTSPYLHNAGNKTFHRQEVYRIGIVFRNNKMQASPVKWICDLKMPTYSDTDLIGGGPLIASYYHLYVPAGTDDAYANMLGIEVALRNFAETGASSWEVVMAPRESDDRSILGQGVLQPTISYSGGSYHGPIHEMETENPTTSATYNAVSMFISPEVAFNKNLEHRAGDWYQKVGYFDFASDNELDETANYEFYHYKAYDFTADDGSYSANWRWSLNSGQIITYDTDQRSRYSLDAETVTPYNQDGNDAGISSTFFAADHVIAAGIYFMDPSAAGSDKVAVVNYRRNVFASQYGGPSYLQRQLNTYVPISSPSMTSTSVDCFEGDTFIDFFSHQKQSNDPDRTVADTTNGSTFLFPVESSISPRLSNSEYVYRHLSSTRHRLMQEIAGTFEGEIGGNEYVLEQEKALYEYNPVYSQLPKSTIHIADSSDFEDTEAYPVRILNSEYKTNNEELDSFTQFKPNNFLDLDGAKGQINNIKTFNNQLYFWQDNGFGIASVNVRSLITDNQPGLLALGTGGILERFDYVSDTIGNQNQFGIVNSRTALYWADNNKSEFFKYDGKVQSMTKIGGVQTWINILGGIGDAKLVYDHKYNDVIFTVTFSRGLICSQGDGGDPEVTDIFGMVGGSTGLTSDVFHNAKLRARYPSTYIYPERNAMITYASAPGAWRIETDPYGGLGSDFNVTIDQDPSKTYTLVFSERINKFISFSSFTPGKYIETDFGYYSTDDYHDLYQHNDGSADRATYFGTTYDSVITTAFNDNYPYTKVWDNLKWVSESFDADAISQFADTFQNVELYNNYQNTGDRTLVVNTTPTTGETELTRREQTWSMSIPRNIVDIDVSSNPDIHDVTNHDETQTFKERMRDKYLTCNFTYDNDDGNTFSIPFISSTYRRSVR